MEGISISVITSLFRCEHYLESYLNYVCNISNLYECEFILIHNDPTPKELNIINNFHDPKVRLVHIIVERENLYTSWNRAIQLSRGKYIGIWNVDDIRSPDSLLAQRATLESSSAVLCYGDFYGTNEYGQIKGKLYQYQKYENFKKEAFKRHIIGCFPMWLKEIHSYIGYFDEQFKLVADYEFQLRVAFNFDLVYTKENLGFYLENASHKLSSNRKLQSRERTVVEVRYRIFHNVLIHLLPYIHPYKTNCILNFGKWVKISYFVPALKKYNAKQLLTLLMIPFYYFVYITKKGFQLFHNHFLQ